MDITFIAWLFLLSVIGYYIYGNLSLASLESNESNTDEEE